MSKFKEIWADSQSTEGGHMSKAEELADAICRIDTLTEYQRELIAQAAAELRRLDALEQAAEPVMIYHGRCTIDCGEHGHQDVEMLKMIPAGSKLYTYPARKPMTRDDMRKLLAEHFDHEELTGDALDNAMKEQP